MRRVAAGDGRQQAVTFESYHDDVGFERLGFGEGFLAAQSITAIHVLCRRNDWFQYAEMPKVLALIREATSSAERVLAYGSSMGGYAAVRFAAAIGAQSALALSPQFSIDPRKARFERRWPYDQRRIRFRPELDGRVAAAPQLVVAFDPTLASDRRHAQRIASATPTILLPISYAGHPCGPMMAELGLLRPLVRDLLDGHFDAAALLRDVHRQRARSAAWLGELAARLPTNRIDYALRLAEAAAARAPDSAPILFQLATRHQTAGEPQHAAALLRKVVSLHPHPIFHWQLARALSATGDIPGARAAIDSALADAPHVAAYHRTAADIEIAAGDRAGARESLRRARQAGGRYAMLAAPWHALLARFG